MTLDEVLRLNGIHDYENERSGNRLNNQVHKVISRHEALTDALTSLPKLVEMPTQQDFPSRE